MLSCVSSGKVFYLSLGFLIYKSGEGSLLSPLKRVIERESMLKSLKHRARVRSFTGSIGLA